MSHEISADVSPAKGRAGTQTALFLSKFSLLLEKRYIKVLLNISRKEKYLLKRAFAVVVVVVVVVVLLCSKMLIFVTFYISPRFCVFYFTERKTM